MSQNKKQNKTKYKVNKQSNSEAQAIFGDLQQSGSDDVQYLTSHVAEQYLRHSDSLTVVRILDGTYGGASAFAPTGSGGGHTGSSAATVWDNAGSSFKLSTLSDGAIQNSCADGTGGYEGGGTAFHNYGEIKPLPTGHALMFPSFTNLHKGLPVGTGDRYLLVFWLFDRNRTIKLYESIEN